MAYMIIRHKVADYATWKPVFDEHSAARAAGGSRGGQLYRSASNPNELIAIFEWDSLDNARQFAQSPNLRDTMQRAGVIDAPDVYFVEKVEDVAK